jgi:hypothetical protein
MNYKKILSINIVAIVLVSILAPVVILAETNNTIDVCLKISDAFSKFEQRADDRDVKLAEKRARILENIDERWVNRDAKFLEHRAKWDINRAEHFAKLEEVAGTDEQRLAVIEFTKTVEASIAVRRAAINIANQDFRTGVDQAAISWRSGFDVIISDFRIATSAVFEKALADCGNGDEFKDVRKNLRDGLKLAKENFRDARQDKEDRKDVLEPLRDARKEAVKTAIEDFKSTLEQAREEFKESFPKDVESNDTEEDDTEESDTE